MADGGRRSVHNAEEMLEKYSATVYRIAYLRTGNVHDAEDVMQDVFVRYIKNAPVFENEAHEKAWFIRTTVNRTKSLFSSAFRRRTIPLDSDIGYNEEFYEGGGLVSELKKLPPDMQTAIHLYYYEDMSVEEAATAMGKSVSAVKSLLFRGRKALKVQLGGGTDDRKDDDSV